MEVSKIYPSYLIDAQHALSTLVFHSNSNIAAIPTDYDHLSPLRFTQDIRLDTLHRHFFAPILHLTSRGGKCWRSFLGLACITAFGVDPEPFKPFLAAIELIHAGELIIDDIEDESPMRRGVASVHTLWGIPTAINAGTAAYFAFDTAMRSISETLRPQTMIVLYQLFFETMRTGHVGQCLDIAGQQQSDLDDILAGRVHPSVLEKRIISTHRLKTAMVAANIAKMSAAIAEASPSQTRALSIHFERVGIAFQIMDDVRDIRGSSYGGADIVGDQKVTDDKPVLKRRGDDIRCGKFSIPIAKAGSMMPLNEAQWVWETVMRKTGNDDITTQQVIDKLEAYGIVDTCVEEAHNMVNDSWADLEGHLSDSPAKVLLRALGWYLVKL
jgi:geranylgeranyl pyrophosphate synthase